MKIVSIKLEHADYYRLKERARELGMRPATVAKNMVLGGLKMCEMVPESLSHAEVPPEPEESRGESVAAIVEPLREPCGMCHGNGGYLGAHGWEVCIQCQGTKYL